jgi:hypothetical protein
MISFDQVSQYSPQATMKEGVMGMVEMEEKVALEEQESRKAMRTLQHRLPSSSNFHRTDRNDLLYPFPTGYPVHRLPLEFLLKGHSFSSLVCARRIVSDFLLSLKMKDSSEIRGKMNEWKEGSVSRTVRHETHVCWQTQRGRCVNAKMQKVQREARKFSREIQNPLRNVES